MALSKDHGDEAQSFEILGIREAEERVYRWLIAHGGARTSQVAQALLLTPRRAQGLLDSIEAKGLATHTPERPRHYIPSSPDIAMSALILQHQKELQRAHAGIQALQNQATRQRQSEPERLVELITSRAAQRQIFEQMQATAEKEVLGLVRTPLLISQLQVSPKVDHHIQWDSIRRGVCYRTVIDAEFLKLPGVLSTTREDIKAGEQIRVASHLPFKMAFADRNLALVPLDLESADSPSLLIRSSALLDALYALFETVWERATPISFKQGRVSQGPHNGSKLPKAIEDMIPLMAAGLNDKIIAGELELSLRTVNRRIADLMRYLDTRSRFQAGWLAAQRLADNNSDS
jgi:sugar-specific transcriptional regulator TrmB